MGQAPNNEVLDHHSKIEDLLQEDTYDCGLDIKDIILWVHIGGFEHTLHASLCRAGAQADRFIPGLW